jgi:hypothetical protein
MTAIVAVVVPPVPEEPPLPLAPPAAPFARIVGGVTPGGTVRSCSAPEWLKVTEPVHWFDGQVGAHTASAAQVTVQSRHVAAFPQAAGVLPGWQELPSQHPPLHVSPPEQLMLQTPVAVSHAWWVGHSAELRHPASTPASKPESPGASAPVSRPASGFGSCPAS